MELLLAQAGLAKQAGWWSITGFSLIKPLIRLFGTVDAFQKRRSN